MSLAFDRLKCLDSTLNQKILEPEPTIILKRRGRALNQEMEVYGGGERERMQL
jgi:hypothetical protein